MNLTIGYLYGDLMNIYGDTGNIITLVQRAKWRGIGIKVKNISIGDKIKKGAADLYFFGGGQDESQIRVAQDLLGRNKKLLKSELDRGVPSLSICGGYQLLGEAYSPQNGLKIKGLGFFPLTTRAGEKRLIGNIVIDSEFGQLIGFENHSGKTYLDNTLLALGKIIKGFGNNGEDQTEGVIYKNSIGCYMHGSLLPKNPKLTDWLLAKALEVKYGKSIELKPLNDTLENLVHDKAIKKFS